MIRVSIGASCTCCCDGRWPARAPSRPRRAPRGSGCLRSPKALCLHGHLELPDPRHVSHADRDERSRRRWSDVYAAPSARTAGCLDFASLISRCACPHFLGRCALGLHAFPLTNEPLDRSRSRRLGTTPCASEPCRDRAPDHGGREQPDILALADGGRRIGHLLPRPAPVACLLQRDSWTVVSSETSSSRRASRPVSLDPRRACRVYGDDTNLCGCESSSPRARARHASDRQSIVGRLLGCDALTAAALHGG